MDVQGPDIRTYGTGEAASHILMINRFVSSQDPPDQVRLNLKRIDDAKDGLFTLCKVFVGFYFITVCCKLR